MKATVDAKAFNAAVRTVAPFVAKTVPIAALTMIRLEVADGVLNLVGSDLDHSCHTSIETSSRTDDANGAVIAPAAFLARTAANFDGELVIEEIDGQLLLVGEDRDALLPLGDPKTWPAIVWPEGDETPLGAAWALLQSILYASDPTETRGYCAGIDLLDGVALCTDSYRMAWCDIPEGPDALIPVAGIRRIAKDLGSDVTLRIGPNVAAFTDGRTTVATRLATGTRIPAASWRQQVNIARNFTVTVGAGLLLDAIAMAGSVPSEEHRPILLRCVEGRLEVSARGTEVGTARAQVVASFDGEWPEQVRVNPPRLAEAVKACGADEITIVGETAEKAVLIEGGPIGQLLMTVHLPKAGR